MRVLIVLFTALTLISCGDKGDEPGNSPFEGTYIGTFINGCPYCKSADFRFPMPQPMRLSFSGARYYYEVGEQNEPWDTGRGTFSVLRDTLTFIADLQDWGMVEIEVIEGKFSYQFVSDSLRLFQLQPNDFFIAADLERE